MHSTPATAVVLASVLSRTPQLQHHILASLRPPHPCLMSPPRSALWLTAMLCLLLQVPFSNQVTEADLVKAASDYADQRLPEYCRTGDLNADKKEWFVKIVFQNLVQHKKFAKRYPSNTKNYNPATVHEFIGFACPGLADDELFQLIEKVGKGKFWVSQIGLDL